MSHRKIKLAFVVFIGLWWFHAVMDAVSTPYVTHLRWLAPFRTSFMERLGLKPVDYRWVPMKNISPYLQQAVIIAEDGQFFTHPGVDVEAMKKAAEINWKKKKFKRGGSTITMQLARNLYLSPRKSLLRKFKELLITLKLERELPKERILELYLNVAEWGDGIYGAESAARRYFKKSAVGLSKYEAAYLAAMLPRPKFYEKHRGSSYLSRRTAAIESRL